MTMDEQALRGLSSPADAEAQSRALVYFENLKASENGWQLCINALHSGTLNDDHVKFFCFQVLEYYVKSRYANSELAHQQFVKKFLMQWLEVRSCTRVSEKSFLKNKAAQVFAMIFVNDYPHQWPSFFSDLQQMFPFGESALDMYLRILMAIDSDVVDREIVHSPRETERNTLIKDTMREQSVPQLVDSWYHIITTYQASNAELVCFCLQVIGAYVSWIDITLIANDRFVTVLVPFMKEPLLRESACDCIHDVISKGMEPISKTKLVESFVNVLDNAGILNPPDDEEADFLAKLAKLINGIGTNLIFSWTKLVKAGDEQNASALLESVERKLPLMFRFLTNDDDDVSAAVTNFAHEYISLLKQLPALTPTQRGYVETLLFIIIKKMKYDDSYNFEHEGEDEVMFLEYRKQLKVIFDNLAQLDKDLILATVHNIVVTTLMQWQNSKFQDVEAAITLLYIIGEALPVSHGNHFFGEATKVTAMQEMMRKLVSSQVSCFQHMAISQQFFETVVRYEKFFIQEQQHLPEVLRAFLDDRGLQNINLKVRSRTAYLFSRFVKSLKTQLQSFTEDILKSLQDLFVLSPPDNGLQENVLSRDDQLFLYESAGILIVSSSSNSQKKQQLMKNLLAPIISKFTVLLENLCNEQDTEKQHAIAECLNHAMAVASRTSKAFSNQQTMKTCGCVVAYTETLQVFLKALHTPYEQHILQAGVRQYLHRMVVCLEDEILPFIPITMEHLLKNSDAKAVQDFIPLINQIIAKFKKQIVPFLYQVFMPLVTAIYNVLSAPMDQTDQQAVRDKQTLQRSYFLFIAAVVTFGVGEVIAQQETQNMQQVLLTVISGAVDIPDPVAQKTCFSILRKLVELWGGKESLTGFEEFMYKNIIPACFLAPLKDTFDLGDAQTILALQESALCLKTILDKRGDQLINFLHTDYLPTLNVNPSIIEEYCQALRSDPKTFKNYIKLFFQRAKL